MLGALVSGHDLTDMGALSDYQNNIVPSEVSLELLEKGKIDKNTKLEDLQKEIKELQIERDTLKKHRDKIVKDYDFAKEMKEEREEMAHKNSKKLWCLLQEKGYMIEVCFQSTTKLEVVYRFFMLVITYTINSS